MDTVARRGLRARVRDFLVVEPDGEEVVAAAPLVALRTLFSRFWPDARPYRAWLALLVLVVALVPAVDAAQIWLFKLVVDEALVPGDLRVLLSIALAYVGLTLAGGVLGFVDDVVSTSVGERFVLALRRRLYGHLLQQGPDVLDRRRLGDLLARVTGDVQTIESFMLGGVTEGISAAFRIALFTGVLLYLQWDLALISLLAAPLFWLTARRFAGLIKDASREKRRRAGSLSAVAEEGLANAPLVQTFNRHEAELERFERESTGILRAELAATRLRALFAPVVELIELGGGLLVITWGALALSRGDLTLGGLLAFLTYLGLLYRPAGDLGHLGASLFAASAAAERVLELLDQEPLVRDREGAVPLGRAAGVVELERVTFRYPGTETPALDGVSLRVRPGELVVLTGASGSGKSTLARLLVRLFDPDEGAVRLDGHDLRDLTVESVRENVGLLLQEALVFDASVRANIEYGRPGASGEEVVAAARAAGAHEFVERLPDGYDTQIGQKGRALSGGQRQRVAIARLLLRDTPVVVLDEPFTGLDAAAVERLRGPIERLAAGRTTVVISHDVRALPSHARVITLAAGRVVGDERTSAEAAA